MSFSETRLDLGIDYGTLGGPRFNTSVLQSGGGNEKRIQNWNQALGRWQIGDRILNKSEYEYLRNFFYARRGAAEGFRFRDWGDYSYTGNIAVATATPATQFQLVKLYTTGSSTFTRQIAKVARNSQDQPICSITVNGSAVTPAVNANTGIITFSQAPSPGDVIAATFEFDVPVRFEQDSFEARFDYMEPATGEQFWYLSNLSVVEVRQ